jgi:hypothetical protein
MGFIRHHAILVTGLGLEVEEAATKAREFGLEVLGPSGLAMNGFQTLLVCPDGSKESWDTSDVFDARRGQFLAYLRPRTLSWLEVAYGNSDRTAKVTAHAWQ